MALVDQPDPKRSADSQVGRLLWWTIFHKPLSVRERTVAVLSPLLVLTGVLLLGVILNLLNLEGTLSPWWQWVIRGAFLLAVVVVQARMQRRVDRE